MSRLKNLERTDLTAEAQKSWDAIALNGTVTGPFQVLMRVPKLAEIVRTLANFLRDSTSLTAADRELAILSTARAFQAGFVCAMHEPTALRVGVRPAAIEASREEANAASLEPREQIVLEVARSLSRSHRLDDSLYARARNEFGEPGLVELVTLIGFYGSIGIVLGAFGVEPPAQR
jgi:4-carboxymuconolactone decarboxylase